MWIDTNNKAIKSHADLHPDCSDIVYIIEYSNGQSYVGKKTVRSWRTLPPLKGKTRKRKVFKDIPFMKYEGSHGQLGLVVVNKIILFQCSNRKTATLLEVEEILSRGALANDKFINANILGKFFPRDYEGILNVESNPRSMDYQV